MKARRYPFPRPRVPPRILSLPAWSVYGKLPAWSREVIEIARNRHSVVLTNFLEKKDYSHRQLKQMVRAYVRVVELHGEALNLTPLGRKIAANQSERGENRLRSLPRFPRGIAMKPCEAYS